MARKAELVLMELVGAAYTADAKVMEFAAAVETGREDRENATELMHRISAIVHEYPPICGMLACAGVLWAMANAAHHAFMLEGSDS